MKRLKSLDEFEPLPWHRRSAPGLLTIPMLLGVALAVSIGALIGLLF